MCIAKRVEFKPNDNPFESQVDPLQNYFLYIDMNMKKIILNILTLRPTVQRKH